MGSAEHPRHVDVLCTFSHPLMPRTLTEADRTACALQPSLKDRNNRIQRELESVQQRYDAAAVLIESYERERARVALSSTEQQVVERDKLRALAWNSLKLISDHPNNQDLVVATLTGQLQTVPLYWSLFFFFLKSA